MPTHLSTSPLAYAFRQPENLDPHETLYAQTLFEAIQQTLGSEPAYELNDPRALDDPSVKILKLNPVERSENPRHYSLYSSCLRTGNPAAADILLQTSFSNDWQKAHLAEPHQIVCNVHTLPSHATPKNLRKIAESYRDASFPWKKEGTVTSAVIIGDLSTKDVFGNQWNHEALIQALRNVIEQRKGPVLLVTHKGMTSETDKKALHEALADWIVPESAWYDPSKGKNKTMTALALGDAAMVSGDSVVLLSDAVASAKPLRLFHDWHLIDPRAAHPSGFKHKVACLWNRVSALCSSPKAIDPSVPTVRTPLLQPNEIGAVTFAARIVENLSRSGVRGPFDPVNNPPTPLSFGSGWGEALQTIQTTLNQPRPEPNAPGEKVKTHSAMLLAALG